MPGICSLQLAVLKGQLLCNQKAVARLLMNGQAEKQQLPLCLQELTV